MIFCDKCTFYYIGPVDRAKGSRSNTAHLILDFWSTDLNMTCGGGHL